MASSSIEGIFGQYPFIRPPRSPTEKEAEISECSNYVWPDLSFGRLRSGQESVHVNVDHIAKGTLFPFGGHLCRAATSAEPASVSTQCQPDLDGCPLRYIPESRNLLIFPLHLFVGEACGKRAAGDLILETVWSVFAPEDEFASAARR